MHLRTALILGLVLCIGQSEVLGAGLFNFWSHILPGRKPEDNLVVPVVSSAEKSEDVPKVSVSAKEVDISSEETSSKITELLNPLSWFKKTRKDNSFEINAELGTVRLYR